MKLVGRPRRVPPHAPRRTLHRYAAPPLIATMSVVATAAHGQDTPASPFDVATNESVTATSGIDEAALYDHLKQTNDVEVEHPTASGQGDSPPVSESTWRADDPAVGAAQQSVSLPTATTSGVTGTHISVPKGEGTVQGMGESFSARLSTGIATFDVPIALPPARGKAQPSLALSYSSAAGSGDVGIGWSLGVPFVARQTDKGPPQYDDRARFHPEQDRFVFNGGQELVPICVVDDGLDCQRALPGEVMPAWGAGWQYFRSRVEGSFLRFFWSPDHRTWRVQSKSGVTMELGVPLDGRGDTNALERNPNDGAQIYRWHLSRQYDMYGDTNGPGGLAHPKNVVVYRYSHDEGRAYLTDIYDTPPVEDASGAPLPQYAHHTRLRYEPRSDVTSSYRSGWLVWHRLRLAGIDVTSKPFARGIDAPREVVRRYHLEYDGRYHTSQLLRVQLEGRCATTAAGGFPAEDGEGVLQGATGCTRLPPMHFEYSHVQGYLADGTRTSPALTGYEAFDERIVTIEDSPPVSLDTAETTLFDADSDALPDVLVTAAGAFDGKHGVYLNGEGGTPDRFVVRHMSLDGVLGASLNTVALGNSNVAVLDLDGDGRANLLHMPKTRRYSVYSPEQRPSSDGGATWWWVGRVVDTADDLDPRIDLGGDAPHLRTVDVNFDGLVDVLRITGTEVQTYFSLGRYPSGDGRFGQAIRTGPQSARLFASPVTSCVPHAGEPVSFADREVMLADMNADGIQDIVRLRRGDVLYWPGRGNGYFGTGNPHDCPGGTFGQGVEVRMDASPYYSDIEQRSLRLEDVSGDGLPDLVQVRFDSIDVWLNVDGTGWTEKYEIDDTPAAPSFAHRVHLVDIDGSGTPDILFGNAGKYQYLDLAGGTRPGLLVKVSNGLGKTTEIEYAPSTREMLDSERSGTPWKGGMPTVTYVVKRVSQNDNLALAGRPPAGYVTEYAYRDPYYEGRQREFRGFAYTEARHVGDANSPTSISGSHFLLGRCQDENAADSVDECAPSERWRDHRQEALKGLPVLDETRDETGTYLSTTHHGYRLVTLYEGLDGRQVRHAQPAANNTYLYDTTSFHPADTGPAATPCSRGADCFPTVTLSDGRNGGPPDGGTVNQRVRVAVRATSGAVQTRSESRTDLFGNSTANIAYGEITGGATIASRVDEIITTSTVPTQLACDPTGWLWRTARTFVSGNRHGDLAKNVRTSFYDCNGDATTTATELRGTLELDRAQGDADAFPERSSGTGDAIVDVPLTSTAYDDFGNPLRIVGAGRRCADVAYDAPYAQFPVTETTYTGGCGDLDVSVAGTGPLTTRVLAFDRGLGVTTSIRDVQGQVTGVVYDAFGRVVESYAPHPDVLDEVPTKRLPTTRISYFLPPETGGSYSLIHTSTQDGASPEHDDYLETWVYVDGLGRTLATLTEAELDEYGSRRWIVGSLIDWDQKGAVRRKYLEHYFTGDPTKLPFDVPRGVRYGRQRYDAFGRAAQTYDLDGTVTLRNLYHALSTDAWDAADLDSGPHAGTPLTTQTDGHGRAKLAIERFHDGNVIESRITETAFTPTGQPEIVYRKRGSDASGAQTVARWLVYDKMDRLVLNVEPDTSKNFLLVRDPNAGESHQERFGSLETSSGNARRAWRYRYNDAGDLVGTSDSRGCGRNFYYDGAGRLLGEDYFPCEPHHEAYSAPDLDPSSQLPRSGAGLEVTYHYDSYPSDAGGDCALPQSSAPEARLARGRLTRVTDRGSDAVTFYDGRGRTQCTAVRVAKPASALSTSDRHAPHWYARHYTYDAADRPVRQTTGASVAELGVAGSHVATEYSTRGTVRRVTSSYGTLIASVDRTADGRVRQIVYGDVAATTTSYVYDDRRRIHNVLTVRAPPRRDLWPSAWETIAGTFPLVLQDQEITYDAVGNPLELHDYRIPEEWPSSAQPVTKRVLYDDLYRAKKVTYEYPNGADVWASPFAAENAGTPSDPRRARPSSHIAYSRRVLEQTYKYDWLGNNVRTTDDQSGFYDRSLGTIDNGTKARGPYQLRHASSTAGPRRGALHAKYDAAGHMTRLAVRRAGPCLPEGATCDQLYVYQWDEVGRLRRARRWDLPIADVEKPPSVSGRNPSADLHYEYAASDQRVLKTAVQHAIHPGEVTTEAHTVYVYPSLELRRAPFDTQDQDYVRNATTEVPYLHANGVRLARVVYGPSVETGICDADNVATKGDRTEKCATLGALRVFFELGDHLGSTHVVVDKATSELVELSTYQAYGAPESDYRPSRWGAFREDYGFTGKESDVEVGLVYFPKRYLNVQLGRWISADPLEVHGAGKAEANVYSYVDARPLASTDPMGLCGPMCVGAVAGAVFDTALQIAEISLSTEKTWQDFSVARVAVSAAFGATGAGLTAKGAGLAKVASQLLNGAKAQKTAQVAGAIASAATSSAASGQTAAWVKKDGFEGIQRATGLTGSSFLAPSGSGPSWEGAVIDGVAGAVGEVAGAARQAVALRDAGAAIREADALTRVHRTRPDTGLLDWDAHLWGRAALDSVEAEKAAIAAERAIVGGAASGVFSSTMTFLTGGWNGRSGGTHAIENDQHYSGDTRRDRGVQGDTSGSTFSFRW